MVRDEPAKTSRTRPNLAGSPCPAQRGLARRVAACRDAVAAGSVAALENGSSVA